MWNGSRDDNEKIGIDLAREKEKLFVSSSDTGNVLMYTYGLHDENWTEMPTDSRIEDNWISRFIKYHAGSKTLLTDNQNRELQTFFVVLDAETRTVRYYEGLGDTFTGDEVVDKKYMQGFSADGSKLLMIHGNDLVDILESVKITQAQSLTTEFFADTLQMDFSKDLISIVYQDIYGSADAGIAAFDLETGAFIADYDSLPGGWMDLVFSGETVYFRTKTTDDDGTVHQAITCRLADGSMESVDIPTVEPTAYLISDALWVTEQGIALIRDHDFESETQRYYTADFQTKEVYHTDPITYEDTTAVWSANGEVFFVTDENCIIAFDRKCMELYRIPCNGMTAESLFASGEDLFVLYGVDKIYRYRVSDGMFLNKIDVEAGSIVYSDCRWDDSQPGTLALFNDSTLNLIDTQHWVVRTHVPDCLSFDLQENLVFTTMNKGSEPMKFGYFQIYDYQQLIEMAKTQLEGMTLSEEMRAKYGLQ